MIRKGQSLRQASSLLLVTGILQPIPPKKNGARRETSPRGAEPPPKKSVAMRLAQDLSCSLAA
jgi:hypothetical protein